MSDDQIARLIQASRELVDSISFDNNGALVGGKWMGGHGGLISRETIAKTDALRRALSVAEEARK